MDQPRAANSNPEVCSFLHLCYTWVTYHHQFCGLLTSFFSASCPKPSSISHLLGWYCKSTNQIPSFLSFQWLFMTLKTKLLIIVLYNLASVYYIYSFSHGWGRTHTRNDLRGRMYFEWCSTVAWKLWWLQQLSLYSWEHKAAGSMTAVCQNAESWWLEGKIRLWTSRPTSNSPLLPSR